MQLRPQYTLALAALALFSVAGCKKAAAPSTTSTSATQTAAAVPTQIGGQNIVHIKSTATPTGTTPQFLSATILPGRGMDVFQIKAYLPGKGVIHVLASPTLAVAATQLNGGPGDEYGNHNFSFGGTFLFPYPNRILGILSPDKKTVTVVWHGQSVALPANWRGKEPGARPVAMHGLILNHKTQDVTVSNVAGGQQVTGVIDGGNFDNHWFSKTDLHFKLTITGGAFDAQITAKNVGTKAEPVSMSWHPYLSIPSGDRDAALLHIPGSQRAQVNNYDDVFPTGKLLPVKGTHYDFEAPNGAPLGAGNYYDDNWSNLKRTNGAVDVTLVDPASNYGIELEGLSPQIRTIQMYSPPTAKFAVVEEQFNFADPFGSEWHGMNTGMVTLQPGQSVTWHVRLKLFTPKAKTK